MTCVQIYRGKKNPASAPSLDAGLARQQFDLLALINNFCSWYKQVLTERNLRLRIKISGAIPRYFFGNPLLTRHLFFATARNSLLYLGAGGVFLEIEPEQLAGRRYAIHFNIISPGKGMPPAKEKDLFQPPPGQAGQTTRDGFSSRSANLYYAGVIATILGGAIRVENSFGSGTRYQIKVRLLSSPV
jgi:two-component system, sensor histidine kinase and response regulator